VSIASKRARIGSLRPRESLRRVVRDVAHFLDGGQDSLARLGSDLPLHGQIGAERQANGLPGETDFAGDFLLRDGHLLSRERN
jgi:hypothetical protein